MKPRKTLYDLLDDIPPVTFILLTLAALLFGAQQAQATEAVEGGNTVASPTAQNEEMARLPETTQPVTLSGRCDDGVAVFSVFNSGARWLTRGQVQVVDVTTGQVLRERQLIMGQGQTASFRVAHSEWDDPRYRLRVSVPDLGVSYVKTFSGACRAPTVAGR